MTETLIARSATGWRSASIVAVGLISVVLFGPNLMSLADLGLHNDRYLQVIVAPFICGFLLYWDRSAVFFKAELSTRLGLPLLGLAVVLGLVVAGTARGRNLDSLAVLSVLVVWLCGFLLCCGPRSFRAGLYPLCCLLLMIPVPTVWMDSIAEFLQRGSAEAAYGMLRLAGMSVLQHEMVFALPGLDFEVAPECSGIHSSIALLLVAIVAGYVFLRSGWSRAILIALTVPLAIVKNAIRIAVIGGLASRVDRRFIDGPFHHQYGGVLFSAVAIVLFRGILGALQRIERAARAGCSPTSDQRGFLSQMGVESKKITTAKCQ